MQGCREETWHVLTSVRVIRVAFVEDRVPLGQGFFLYVEFSPGDMM
jgi:hypothetical protein